jgi:hypothetical protein
LLLLLFEHSFILFFGEKISEIYFKFKLFILFLISFLFNFETLFELNVVLFELLFSTFFSFFLISLFSFFFVFSLSIKSKIEFIDNCSYFLFLILESS